MSTTAQNLTLLTDLYELTMMQGYFKNPVQETVIFDAFYRVINKYHPKYFVHGHMHMNYGRDIPREDFIGDTKVINAYERYVIEI